MNINTLIKYNVYTTLSARQRVAATLAALARNDDAEVARLRETCPPRRYIAAEESYPETMNKLRMATLRLDADLRGLAIDYLAANLPSGRETKHQARIISLFASTREAWHRQFREMQIDLAHLHAISGPQHDYVDALVKHAEGKHDEATVESLRKSIRTHFAC